jgi:hypothetical protein
MKGDWNALTEKPFFLKMMGCMEILSSIPTKPLPDHTRRGLVLFQKVPISHYGEDQ